MHGMRRAPALLLLCLLPLAAGGCTGRLLVPRADSRPAQTQESLNALASATQAYKAGDYDRAGDLFLALSLVTSDPVLSRKALFGLACTRLAAADSEEDMDEALEIWSRWASLAPDNPDIEDPRLLTPLLPRLAPDGNGTRETVQHMEKEMNKLRSRLKQKSEDLEELQSQLDALEQLHREITIRKQGIN